MYVYMNICCELIINSIYSLEFWNYIIIILNIFSFKIFWTDFFSSHISYVGGTRYFNMIYSK